MGLHSLVALAQVDAGRRVLDQAVAAVDDQVITASQLDFEARVLLVNEGGVAAATATLDDETLARSLSSIIDYRVATLEADKLDAYPVDPQDLAVALTAFKSRFRSEGEFREFLERHDADVDDVRALLRRTQRAQRALDGKLRLKAQVSLGEARQYLSQHPELADTPLDAIRVSLFTQRFRTLVREELEQGRRGARVRLLGPFSPKPRGAAPR